VVTSDPAQAAVALLTGHYTAANVPTVDLMGDAPPEEIIDALLSVLSEMIGHLPPDIALMWLAQLGRRAAS
jgi:hypothetical protein